MANKDYSKEDGVWRTIGGRRVFIRTGQSLSDAMKESGKFSRVAKNQELYKKVDEENKKIDELVKKEEKKDDKKTIHTTSGDYTPEEINKRDSEIKNLYKAQWNGEMSAKELNDKLEKMRQDGKVSYGELSSLQYDASREYDKELDNQPKTSPITGKPIHKLGQLNETDEEFDISKSSSKNYFDKHEAERLEIAKDIAKELNPSLKNASEERLEKEAKRLLEAPEGAIEKGETFYTNQKGELERGTPSLEKWRDELKKTSESKVSQKKLTNEDIIKMNDDELQKTYDSMLSNYYSSKDFYDHGTENMLEQLNQEINNRKKEKGFTQKIDFSGTEGHHYTSDELKKMEENGIRPLEHSYTGGGWEGVNSDKFMDTKDQAKAINDAMKKKYPDVKIARKTNLFSGGSSIDFNIMSSDKDLFVSDSDIDKMGYEDLHDVSRSNGFEWWAKDNVPGYNDNHSYNIDDVRKYAKQSLAQRKTSDIQGVTGKEWYLNDYGKKVVSDLNKEANSYTYSDSDGMIDYFDHGTYMHISIGKWNKPYEVKGNSVTSALKTKAYQKYLKEHPGSKMTLEDFKKKK